MYIELSFSNELPNLGHTIGLAFSKPESFVRPSRYATRDAILLWQREPLHLACRGDACNIAGSVILSLGKPDSAIWPARDAIQEIMGQCELADLALRSDLSNLAGSIVRAYFGKPEIAIRACGDILR